MKAAFITLGCKVNQYETQAMVQALEKRGYEIVSPDCPADIFVINSCTVTAESDRKVRQTVRRYKRENPYSVVVLTGCLPQAFKEEAYALEQADIVIGNKSNTALPALLERYFADKVRITEVDEHKSGEPFSGDIITCLHERTRANIKIEDGCNRFCSYCIIPYARGRVRSKPLNVLINEAQTLASNGYSEIVLVGINLSAYGTDTHEADIADAVAETAKIDGIKRIRLGSLEPDHMTDEILDKLCKTEKFCPQFHISLQSGCSKTLKRMNRHYTAEEYYELCRKLRDKFTDATITTDIMVGFPGESDEDFAESLAFAQKVGFEKAHVFPYSRRGATPAARMPDQIPNVVKQDRAAKMIAATNEIRQNFLSAQVGKTVEVLVEERVRNGMFQGYTANYTPVRINGECECGKIIKAKIIGVDGDFCLGETI